MDYKVIVNLMKEMNRTDLTKLEIEEEGTRICLEKASNVITVSQPQETFTLPAYPAAPMNMMPMPQQFAPFSSVPVGSAPVAPMNQEENQASNTAGDNTDKSAQEANYKKIVSPMVGTFYASPSPDKPAFIKVGDKVKKGQTVCIIEAMKLMNEIESEQDGEIVKILVDNEAMVEFGQPMFLVK